MTIELDLQGDFCAGMALAAARVLFGTAGLSGVSAFATARIGGRRFGAKVNA
jgi:hypothetical protein